MVVLTTLLASIGAPRILTAHQVLMCLARSASERLLVTKGSGFRFLKISLVLAHHSLKKKMFTTGKNLSEKCL